MRRRRGGSDGFSAGTAAHSWQLLRLTTWIDRLPDGCGLAAQPQGSCRATVAVRAAALLRRAVAAASDMLGYMCNACTIEVP